MFISSPQKAYFEKMSGDEQAKLQQMDRAKMKEILEELIARPRCRTRGSRCDRR